MGLTYIWENRVGRYWVDFYLPSLNTVIECDEPYWHVAEKDRRKDTYVRSRIQGVTICRFTTKEIRRGIEWRLRRTLGLRPASLPVIPEA